MTAKKERPPCGSLTGAADHRKHGEEPCKPCLDAAAAYMREYRKVNAESRKRENARNNARNKALSRLSQMFYIEYMTLYDQELREVGLLPERPTP